MSLINKDSIKGIIHDFYHRTFENHREEDMDFGQPIVGVSSGSDPLYAFLKEDIGEFLWTPEEAFSKGARVYK